MPERWETKQSLDAAPPASAGTQTGVRDADSTLDTAREQSAAPEQLVDDCLECFSHLVADHFPADRPTEDMLVSDELLYSLHACVRDCVVALRDAGAQKESAVALIRLSMAELGERHAVHPAIIGAVTAWANVAYDED